MKTDTMWRDPSLGPWHAARGIPFPAEGMTLPMVEYDRGAPVGIISYIRRDQPLPTGGSSYRALAGLYTVNGEQLPFITVQYDPSNWAFRLIGHNQAGRRLIGADGWLTCTETFFVGRLYAMRGRNMPGLERYDVRLSNGLWYQDHLTPNVPDEDLLPFPGADISARRRSYEPVRPDGGYVSFNLRNPCVDMDLAVSCNAGRLRLVVDYKSAGVVVDGRRHTSHMALGSLYRLGGHQVPHVVARTVEDGHSVEILGMNVAGDRLVRPELYGGWREVSWDQWASMLGSLAVV